MALSDLIPFRKGERMRETVAPRRPPQHPLLRLQDEMNRLFDDFLPSHRHGRSDLAPGPGTAWDFMPEIDVRESRKMIQVTAELPGLAEKDLDVRLDGNLLTIRGEKREEKTDTEGDWTHTERCYGSFVRSVPLGTEVDEAKIAATLKKGVLKITLPKRGGKAAGNGRIEVKAG